jgi:pimeloyl-ACP methyl ester carboxylesterase
MPKAKINGTTIVYEVLGDGPPLVLTPGGRFGKDVPGVRPLAEKLAKEMTVVLWDRPNTGDSDFKFTGASESEMAADDLAELLRTLDLTPAVIAGGSAGSRISLITAFRHAEVVHKLVVWMMSGGKFGTMFLAMNYLLPHMAAAWADGMEAVCDVRDIKERIQAHPELREQIVGWDRQAFLDQLDRWLDAYVPKPGYPLPGVHQDSLKQITAPTLIFRNNDNDLYHAVEASLKVHELISSSTLVEPPWPRDSWFQTKLRQKTSGGNLFDDWIQLAQPILEFVRE